MFWRKKGAGYGTNLGELKTYTIDEAQAQNNRRESDIPLLKSLVDASSIISVDSQYLPISGGGDDFDKYVVQKKHTWNGNDILFVGLFGLTYDYGEAQLFSNESIDMGYFDPEEFDVFSKSAIDKIARRTFQYVNVSIKSMTLDPGIKLAKPKKTRPATGKYRGNCTVCGRITWAYNPHETARCNGCC